MKKLYSLFAAVVMTVAVNAQVFNATFDDVNGTGGNDNLWSGSAAGSDLNSYSTGGDWGLTKAFKGNQCIKLGTGSALGSITTPAIELTGSGILTFRAGAWSGDSSTLKISAMGGTLDAATVILSDAAFTTYAINISGASGALKIKFEGEKASKSRFFIDDIKVVAEDTPSVTPVLAVDKTSLEFPQTLVGSTSEAQTLTVTGENLDAVPTYELSGADASEFSVSGSLTAEGGALSLTFHPATSGTKTATLTVTSGSLSQMVTLSGEGKALPVLTVDTDSLEFPETVVGQTSTEKIVEVDWANVSGFPTYNITGENADAFNIVDAELKVDETGGYLYIVFKPTTEGTKTATLTLAIDGITKTVALSGTAVEDASLAVGDINTINTKLVKNTLVDNALVFSANAEVKIYNVSGQLVKTARVSENTAVDVAGFAKGIYVVTGIVDGKAISQKIIKK
ncbi:choice-of-anchor D domain-containing protein [Weeksellaceae bacterium A-14]